MTAEVYLAILRSLGTHKTMSPTSYDVVTGKGYWIPIVPETRRRRPRPQQPQGPQPTETSTTEMITEVITESVTEVNTESVTEMIVIVCPWCGVGLLYLSLSVRKF